MVLTESQRLEFIKKVAPIAQKVCKKYGLPFPSVVIGQACKESTFGTSDKVINNGVYMHNYLGIKFNNYQRVPIAIGAFNELTKEQYSPTELTTTVGTWYKFASLDDCVEGYCQFLINAPGDRYRPYLNARTVKEACEQIKACGYATGATYADSLYENYVLAYNLTQYDENTKYTNSPLATYMQISPCKDVNRTHVIDTITIHCYVGQVGVERMGSGWSKLSANASANYGIGLDGRIGLYVDEKDRAWTTGGKWAVNGITGSENDQRAVTIECACDTTAPYAINDKVMESLIKLVADIARRNNMGTLKWKGDSTLVGKPNEQNMTVHRWFTSKSCPGDYIYNRLSYIATEANKINSGGTVESPTVVTEPTYVYHTIVRGETLGGIASAYGTTVAILKYYNADKITDVNKIQTGWVIRIPTRTDIVPKTYTVVKGDTLWKISKATGVELANLKALNADKVKAPFYVIYPGMVLKLQ